MNRGRDNQRAAIQRSMSVVSWLWKWPSTNAMHFAWHHTCPPHDFPILDLTSALASSSPRRSRPMSLHRPQLGRQPSLRTSEWSQRRPLGTRSSRGLFGSRSFDALNTGRRCPPLGLPSMYKAAQNGITASLLSPSSLEHLTVKLGLFFQHRPCPSWCAHAQPFCR